ncbi:MAG TPA: DUF2871 domain-containing protein [Kineosporiaceae bacterium]|nr:DUF2871 domain-containing protein [Kineosporiaceae bacterium]
MRKIYNAAAVYAALGLAAGVYYRELTKAQSFTGRTQLAFAHVHLLALGTLFFLVVLVLEKSFSLTASPWFNRFFVVYQVGLGLASLMFLVHGTITVLGKEAGPAISGIAGLGHIGLAAGFALFFVALRERVTAAAEQPIEAVAPVEVEIGVGA